MKYFIEGIKGLITSDNITLLSVIITFLIFILTRRAEIKYKKYEDKKIQYLKLMNLMKGGLVNPNKDKFGNYVLTKETKDLFFDAGSSLLLYGSKRIYRQYLLFREFTSNPLIKQCKYYDDSIIIFIVADIFKSMRKEVGLSYFNNINSNETLGFFVNDVTFSPISKEKAIDAKIRITLIKFELSIIDHTRLLFLKSLYKNTFGLIIGIFNILIKHLFLIPIGKILIKVNLMWKSFWR